MQRRNHRRLKVMGYSFAKQPQRRWPMKRQSRGGLWRLRAVLIGKAARKPLRLAKTAAWCLEYHPAGRLHPLSGTQLSVLAAVTFRRRSCKIWPPRQRRRHGIITTGNGKAGKRMISKIQRRLTMNRRCGRCYGKWSVGGKEC